MFVMCMHVCTGAKAKDINKKIKDLRPCGTAFLNRKCIQSKIIYSIPARFSRGVRKTSSLPHSL